MPQEGRGVRVFSGGGGGLVADGEEGRRMNSQGKRTTSVPGSRMMTCTPGHPDMWQRVAGQ